MQAGLGWAFEAFAMYGSDPVLGGGFGIASIIRIRVQKGAHFGLTCESNAQCVAVR